MARLLSLPMTLATLATLAVNLIPLYGVLWWGWDTFQLLFLYWCETVIVAFWTIRRLARLPDARRIDPGPFGLTGFFTLHAGMFIGVHFIFLWAFFSWDWFTKVHGVGSFFFELFVANGVWVALICMLIVHSVAYLTDPGPDARAQTRESGDGVMPIVGGLYVRIVIMQLAIIFGAWFSGFTGSMAPLVIVIVLKTLLDLGQGVSMSFKALTAASATPETKG